jgi:hypothetical protein
LQLVGGRKNFKTNSHNSVIRCRNRKGRRYSGKGVEGKMESYEKGSGCTPESGVAQRLAVALTDSAILCTDD